MDNSFDFGGRKFKLNKIDALKQFHIVRRIGPILTDLLPVMKGITQASNSEEQPIESQLENAGKFLGPIMNGLSKLSDSDSELVLHGLLHSVEVQQAAGNWAKISTGSMLMIQDMELPVLLQIAGRAFMFNLSGFFAGLPQK